MTRKHNNILRQIGKLGLITPACVVLLSVKSRFTLQSASLDNNMSNATTEVNQPQTKSKKPRFAKVLPHVILACNKAKMGALKDIAVYLALNSFKEGWKYNSPHIEETVGTSRNIVAKYLALLHRMDVLRPVEKTACRNVKYYLLNRAKYVELFETEPDNAASSPLLQALQLHSGSASKQANQLHCGSAASCPSTVQSVALQNDSVALGQCNSISRYRVEGMSKKEHKDSVCVFSHSLSDPANPNADEFCSTDTNPSSAVLAPAEPEQADASGLANTSDSVSLGNRFALPDQSDQTNGSFSTSSKPLPQSNGDGADTSFEAFQAQSRVWEAESEQAAKATGYDRYDEATKYNPTLPAKTKADIVLAYVNWQNSCDPTFMLPRNLAELALNYFKANPSKSAQYLIAVLQAMEGLTWGLQPAEGGYDTHFNLRRSHNLAFLFKHIDRLINEINTLNNEYGFFSLEQNSTLGFKP
jgi:hypothetical protein